MVYFSVMLKLFTFLLKCHVKSLERSQFDWHSWRIQFKMVSETLHIQMHRDLSLINPRSKAENVRLKFLHQQSSQACRVRLLNACRRSEKLNETMFCHASITSVFRRVSPSHLLFHTPALLLSACVCVCVCVCSWLQETQHWKVIWFVLQCFIWNVNLLISIYTVFMNAQLPLDLL